MGKGLPYSLKRAQQSAAGRADRGTVAGTGVAMHEDAVGGELIEKTLTFTNAAIALTDEAGVVAYGGLKVFDFPQGLVKFEGAVMDLALTKSSAGVNDTWDGDVGLGTITASNNATLAAAEQSLVPTTATPQAVAGTTTADAQSTDTEAGVVHDGTTTAVDMYLNFLVDDADQDVTTTPCNLIVNGTVTFSYMMLGDN